MKGLIFSLAVLTATFAPHLHAQGQAGTAGGGQPPFSIIEVMENTITPATNTLWDAFEPPEDEAQWDALEEAAVTLLVASRVIAQGGNGPMDNERVMNPEWKAFNQALLEAGLDALRAIRVRDHDAFLEASDRLYTPCVECHKRFNPGVAGQQ